MIQPKEEPCPSCHQKQQLIHKYMNLVQLFKKKGERKDNSVHSNPDQPSNNVSTRNGTLAQTTLLVLALANINKKRTIEAFRRIFRTAVEQKCHRGFKLTQTLERCISKRVQEGTRMLWLATNKPVMMTDKITTDTDKNVSTVLLDVSSHPRNKTCFVQSPSQNSNDKIHSLSRRCFALNRELQGLKWSNKMLQDQIEQNYRRQQIESKKKKQSLEMLAQQMAEKNELICQLQTALQFYESKQGRTSNNILEEDGVALQKEIETLQKINEKVNIELEKRTEHLTRAEQQLQQFSEKYTSLQKENTILKEKNFEMSVEVEGLDKKKQEYYNLSSFLEKKMSSLKKYEKIISNHLKAIEQHSNVQKSSFNVSLRLRNNAPLMQDDVADNPNDQKPENSFAPISKFETQYKIQKILNYIFNIELEDVWINNDEKIFDNEQIQVLNTLKLKFIQLNEEIKTLKKQRHEKPQQEEIKGRQRMSKQCGQSDEVYFNQHNVSGSIFEVLATEKQNKEKERDHIVSQFQPKGCPHCINQKHNGDVTTRRDHQNFTIKLLELELQKNKQIQKISQLKNKMMHIRCIVMNFMKSLDFKSLKPEARDIAELFFELFEYSEQQKQLILHQNQVQKRLWGLF